MTTAATVIGKLHILSVNDNDFTSIVSYERVNNRIQKIKWKVQHNGYYQIKPEDAMTIKGFAPAGYGMPFNIELYEKYYTFESWGSCD